jgi:hypothetical protein
MTDTLSDTAFLSYVGGRIAHGAPLEQHQAERLYDMAVDLVFGGPVVNDEAAQPAPKMVPANPPVAEGKDQMSPLRDVVGSAIVANDRSKTVGGASSGPSV